MIRAALTTSALLLAAAAAVPAGAQLAVSGWGYQLQELDLVQLRDSGYDLLVIDYSTTGGPDGELSAEQVRSLRQDGPCGARLVLAYLSIGEAEDYRYYFDPAWLGPDGQPSASAPAWLGPTNPEWEGNYKVRYWRRDWQRVLMGGPDGDGDGYLDRILAAGFDGIYLDIIDAWEYWGPAGFGGNGDRERAAKDMVTLVRRLERYARRNGGGKGFLLVPQNGAGIIDVGAFGYAADPGREADRQRQRYFRAIDAIGAEDTFFYGDRDENNPLRPQREVIDWLDRFHEAGLPVLAIDYLTQRSKVDEFWRRATERGWVPYVSVRELDELYEPPGHAPVCQ